MQVLWTTQGGNGAVGQKTRFQPVGKVIGPVGDDREPGVPTVELKASASDLLLWMWNRVPGATLTVSGDDTVVTWWKGLAI